MYGMALSNIGDGGVHNGGGVLWRCGFYNGSNPSLFGKTLCVPAEFSTRADKLLRVLPPVRLRSLPPAAPLWFIKRADTLLWLPYTDMT